MIRLKLPRAALLLCLASSGCDDGASSAPAVDGSVKPLDAGAAVDATLVDAAGLDQGASGGPGGAGGGGGAGGAGGGGGAGGAGGGGGAGGAADPDLGLVDAAAGDGGLGCAAGVVTFPTEDGVRLTGDLSPGGPRGVVLLHMIPPSNDRSNYPAAFIEALTARGFTVLNVDRRGAGDSEGEARAAYEGPAGRLDALAAETFLLESGCGIAPGRVAFVGASNGTTTVLDHAVAAPDARLPSALVFLTGGAYTENQTRIADHRPRLDALPIRFVFSTQERAWSAAFEAEGAPAWVFDEYPDGAHGTRMFGAAPAAIDAVAGWLDEVTR